MVLDEAVLDNQEDGEKLIWLFDIREPTNPVSIATFPPPDEADYVAKGRISVRTACVRSSRQLCQLNADFCHVSECRRAGTTFQPYRPLETGALVPAAPERMMDIRPGRPQVIQSCDVFVDAQAYLQHRLQRRAVGD